MTQFLSLAAWDPSHGHGLGLEDIALGPWPRAWLKANGHKLGAMAQDIRYPGVRVGEACGPGVALLGRVEGRKSYAYHYHTITIMGLSQPASQPAWASGHCPACGLDHEAIA